MEYSGPDLYYLSRYIARYQHILAHEKSSFKQTNPAEVVCTREKQFLKEDLNIALYFMHPCLRNKPNLIIIFKLGVKETGQSTPAIIMIHLKFFSNSIYWVLLQMRLNRNVNQLSNDHESIHEKLDKLLDMFGGQMV